MAAEARRQMKLVTAAVLVLAAAALAGQDINDFRAKVRTILEEAYAAASAATADPRTTREKAAYTAKLIFFLEVPAGQEQVKKELDRLPKLLDDLAMGASDLAKKLNVQPNESIRREYFKARDFGMLPAPREPAKKKEWDRLRAAKVKEAEALMSRQDEKVQVVLQIVARVRDLHAVKKDGSKK